MSIPGHYLERNVKCNHCAVEFIAIEDGPAVDATTKSGEAKRSTRSGHWVIIALIIGILSLVFSSQRHFQSKKKERYSTELLTLAINSSRYQGSSFNTAVNSLEIRHFGQPLGWTKRKNILDNYWTDSDWVSDQIAGLNLSFNHDPRRSSMLPPILLLRNRIAGFYDPNSLANPYGAGSPYLGNGLMNPYSRYGSQYSNKSWTNPYATDPPKLYGPDGTYLGKFSSNQFDSDSISNPYGRYGNPYSPDSVNNPFGAGNPYRTEPLYVVPQK